MKCKICGQDVPEGQIYCSCGAPVTYDKTQPMQSENVYSAPVVAKKKTNVKSLIVILIIIALGIGFYFFKNSLCYTVPAFYHEVSTSDFTMKIPSALKKESSTDSDTVAFYTSEKAAVNITKIDYSVNPALESIELKDFGDYAALGGFDGDFTYKDDFVYTSYNDSASGVMGDTQDCYVIEALYKGDDALWSVNAYCRVGDKAEFEDSLLKWVESFELK